jgi:hypothetical protein
MHPWQLAGGALAALHSLPVTDLGPYWAVRHGLPATLGMRKMTFKWPAEMVVRPAPRRARIVEVPDRYRWRRPGHSKVSATLKGTLLAGYATLGTTFKYSGWSEG